MSDPGREREDGGVGPDGLDIERLLADALRPVDPPVRFSDRLGNTFGTISEAAADELSSWAEELEESELRSLRDPRNWVRPVAALTAGGLATGVLVAVGLRRRTRLRR